MSQDRTAYVEFANRPYPYTRQEGRIVHILCVAGSLGFVLHDTRYDISPGDYVIFPDISMAEGFSESDDYAAITMSLSEQFVASLAIRSDYGVVGHLSLLRNPVMHLSIRDFNRCMTDMQRIRERTEETGHLFHDELVGHLVAAHILDLYDIHAKNTDAGQVTERTAALIGQFVGLLYNGACISHRNLDYYASKLFITPHYLSEACRKASGRPATYWIERFTIREITRLLARKELSIAEIADIMHFSSISYFSRYVQKRMGTTPSAYRHTLHVRNGIRT